MLYCAYEAALCWQCDDVVHAANKLSRERRGLGKWSENLDPPSMSDLDQASYSVCEL